MSEHAHKKIAVLYHGGCPDGLGGAYAAWKKFGDTAEYIPARHGLPPPEGLEGKEVFLIDFTYPKEFMDQIVRVAANTTSLDHHLGVKEIVESMPRYIFDNNHSGAIIAWNYFHPHTPAPKLLQYIEDGDLYRFTLPHSREVLAYEYVSPLLTSTFEHWGALIDELEDSSSFERIRQIGTYFQQYHQNLVANAIRHADIVRFEGYECYLTGAIGELVSDVGNGLVKLKPPFALVTSANAAGIKVSLRSDGSVDVAALARKYGGNGHPASAGFRIQYGDKAPWELVKENEHSRR